ncbi:hypothetical protein NFB56_15905 [Yersinia ruckeri]|uniref:phage baseplate protein n=1 Tax=Yersinia ruckeri TaxID=29486 RepID=UPI002237F608|nr:hypothetical protein [Yersinia ruckeri]MCW6550324.1 hypothetical protein [Yersinia ruckeri]
MSIINVFTKQAPTLAGYSFDAVLEDSLDASVEWTTYPVESGVSVNDHRIIQPIKWSLTGAISNNPLQTQITDFLGGALSNLTNNPYVATVLGLSAGFLAGSNETRASSTLLFLIDLMVAGDPFDVDAGDIQLKNMVISRIGRVKDPSNEQGLIFVADLQELITIDRLATLGQPRQSQLRDGDVAKSGLAGVVQKGQQLTKDATTAVSNAANEVLDGIF